MSLLIIKIAQGETPEIRHAIKQLTACAPDHREVDVSLMDIRPCNGCFACMLATPGQCCIPDDNKLLLQAYPKYAHIVFIVDTALGYIDYKAKNVFDRMFPMVNVLTRFHEGEILHLPRYDVRPDVTLLYIGNANRAMLNKWMERFRKNMTVETHGAFPLEDVQEVCQWIS